MTTQSTNRKSITLHTKDLITGAMITIPCTVAIEDWGTTYLVATELEAYKVAHICQHKGTKIEYSVNTKQYLVTAYNDFGREHFFNA